MKIKNSKQAAIFMALAALCVLFLFAARFWEDKRFTYSNLVDSESRETVRALLQSNGIPPENTDIFLSLVEEYYSVPYGGNAVSTSGWKEAVTPLFSYADRDGFLHQEQQDQTLNCRSVSFLLLKDSIAFRETSLKSSANLDPFNAPQLFEDDALLHYNLLFADIERPDRDFLLPKTVPEYWKEAGIRFPDKNVRLITTYGVEDGVIKNYHAAVAFYCKEEIWLLEKYNPIHPYQLSRFSDEQRMTKYMKKCVSGTDEAAVFSNDCCLWSRQR